MLILIAGLPATGKSTLARAVSESIGARHLNSDNVRDALGLRGRYSPEDKETVYHALLERAREALRDGQDVVVDSTFYKDSIREPFRRLANATGARLLWVVVKAREQSILERLKTPRADSEADMDVYIAIRDAEEPLEDPHLTVWSDDETPEEMVAAVRKELGLA